MSDKTKKIGPVKIEIDWDDSLAGETLDYKVLFKQFPGTFYQCKLSKDGFLRFTFMSARAKELWGIEAKQWIEDSSVALDRLHPVDANNLMKAIKESALSLCPWEWKGRYQTPSGENKWVMGYSEPQKSKGGIAWDGILLDITDGGKVIDEILLLMRGGVFFRFRTDSGGSLQIPYMNSGSKYLLDIDNQQAMDNSDWFFKHVFSEDRESFRKSLEQSSEDFDPWYWEGRFVTPSGRTRSTRVLAEPESLPDGGVQWVGTMANDMAALPKKKAS